jgi:hypothetical protein
MTAEDNRRISIVGAVECVRFMMYGEECVGPPTKREEDLVEEYGERPANVSSIIPSMLYTATEGGNRRWAAYHSDSDLANEIASALDRHRWWEKQYKRAEEYLEECGFDLDAESFPIGKLARELKRDFPDAYLRFARAGGLLPLNRPLDEQKALNSVPKAIPEAPEVVEQEVASPAPEETPHVVEQLMLSSAPDASPAPQIQTVESDAVKPSDDAGSTAQKQRGKSGPKSNKAGRCVDAFQKRRSNGIPIARTLEEEAYIVSDGIGSHKTAQASIREYFNTEKSKLKTKI